MKRKRSKGLLLMGRFTELANRLKFISFSLEDDAFRQFKSLHAEGKHWRHINMTNRGTYRVQMSLQGEPTLLGITTNLYTAVRYSNMAELYFWNYRLRGHDGLATDADLNLGVELARTDIRDNTQASDLLHEIELAAVSTGYVERSTEWDYTPSNPVTTARLEESLRKLYALLTEANHFLRSNSDTTFLPASLSTCTLDFTEESEKAVKSCLKWIDTHKPVEDAQQREEEIEHVYQEERERAQDIRLREESEELERVRAELDRQAKQIDPERNYRNLFTEEDVKKLVEKGPSGPTMSDEEIKERAAKHKLWGGQS